MEIRTKIKITNHQNTFEEVPMLADSLIDKLQNNKLKKVDRELLIDAVSLLYEMRVNKE